MSEKLSAEEQELVASLRLGKVGAFEELYARYYKMVASFVQNNSGDDEDTKDLFQEMLFILVKKLREPDFQLTSKLGTYIYAVARHLWLRRLKQRGRIQLSVQEEEQERIDLTDEEIRVKEEFERKHELMASVLETLKEDCRKVILAAFYQKRSHKEIAQMMDYTLQFVKVKMHRCMGNFRKKVQSRPEFKTFENV